MANPDVILPENATLAKDGQTRALIHTGSGTKDRNEAQKEFAAFLTNENTRRHHLDKADFDKVVKHDINCLKDVIAATDTVVLKATNQPYDSAKLMREHAQWWRSHLQTYSVMFAPTEALERRGNPEDVLGYYVPGTFSWALFMQGDRLYDEPVYSGLLANHVVTPGGPGMLYPFKDTLVSLPGDVLRWAKKEDLAELAAVISSSYRLHAHCQPGGMYKPERHQVPEMEDSQALLQLSPRHKIKHFAPDGSTKEVELPNFMLAAIIMNRKVHEQLYQDHPERKKADIKRMVNLLTSVGVHAADSNDNHAQKYQDILSAMTLAFTPPGIAFDEIKKELPGTLQERFDGWLAAAKKTHHLQERTLENLDTIPYGPKGKKIRVEQRYVEAGKDFEKMWERTKQKPFTHAEGASQVPAAWLLNAPITEKQAIELENKFSKKFTGIPARGELARAFPKEPRKAYKAAGNEWADQSFDAHVGDEIVAKEGLVRGFLFKAIGKHALRGTTGWDLLPPPYDEPAKGGIIKEVETAFDEKRSALSGPDETLIKSAIFDSKMLMYAIRIHGTPFRPLGFNGVEALKDYGKTCDTLTKAVEKLAVPDQQKIEKEIADLRKTMHEMETKFTVEKNEILKKASENRQRTWGR